MQYIKLGTTGLDVSPIAIGAMTYGQPDRGHPLWSLGESDARALIRHALDVGINFFDTANVYSQGSSEEILGHALHDFANRDDVVIATKLRHPMRSGPNGKGLSRKAIMTEVEHSLTPRHRLHRSLSDPPQRPHDAAGGDPRGTP
jgi:aryl-alcohol dehydrogenase-like predicted oxidoreductase